MGFDFIDSLPTHTEEESFLKVFKRYGQMLINKCTHFYKVIQEDTKSKLIFFLYQQSTSEVGFLSPGTVSKWLPELSLFLD